MNDTPIELLFGALATLLILSAFFSSSETGMMSLNRYRLKHLANEGHRAAKLASKLLDRPDRLIGIILIGNNLVNIAATSLATLIALRLYGEVGVVYATFMLTLAVLIFAEVTPKTIAALHPEKVAFPASFILQPLLILLYPAVWLVNHVSNFLLKLLGINPQHVQTNHLRPEELKTVVNEAGDLLPDQHQDMLINVLDLENTSVEDIMIPRKEVVGVDLEQDIDEIIELLQQSEYTRLPVFEGDIDNIVGVLHLRDIAKLLRSDQQLSKETIRQLLSEPYFIPESTSLNVQLLNFQQRKHHLAVVVNEYGEVQGIATLVDLLEEIVGEFTTDIQDEVDEITYDSNGRYKIDGGASIRDINKALGWDLPTAGPKTFNGLIVERLESFPDANIGFRINNYYFETTEIADNFVRKALAWKAE